MLSYNACRGLFWVDLITTMPIEGIAVGALGIRNIHQDKRALYLGLVRWLKIVSAPLHPLACVGLLLIFYRLVDSIKN